MSTDGLNFLGAADISEEASENADEITEFPEISGVSSRSGLNPTAWRYRDQGFGYWLYTTDKRVADHFGRGTAEGLITVDAAKALLKSKTRPLTERLAAQSRKPSSKIPRIFNKSNNGGIRKS